MNVVALRRVCVWFDGLTPEQGVFVPGLDWAERLALPLCGSVPGPESTGCAEWLAACAGLCRAKGLAWEGHDRAGAEAADNLHVVSGTLPPQPRKELVRRLLQRPDAALLVSPPAPRPPERALLVQQDGDPDNPFLDMALGLCHALDFAPVVLTVAGTEAEGQRRQAIAEKKLAGRLLMADQAVIVGADLHTAVSGVVRWCRCTHVFIGRTRTGLWRRWLKGDTLEQLLDLSTEIGILALPDSRVSAGDQMQRGRRDRAAHGVR